MFYCAMQLNAIEYNVFICDIVIASVFNVVQMEQIRFALYCVFIDVF